MTRLAIRIWDILLECIGVAFVVVAYLVLKAIDKVIGWGLKREDEKDW